MSMRDKWDEAERTGEPVDLGDLVVCDRCDKDYTGLPDSGGFIFSDRAYCPECADAMMTIINAYGEEKYIKATCPDGVPFAKFVRDYRGDRNYIQVSTMDKSLNDL